MNEQATEPTPSHRGCRWLILVLILIGMVVGGWALLQFIGPYSSLRRQAVYQVGIDRLQEWAISVLDNPPTEFNPSGPEGRLRPEDVPSDIQRLGDGCFIVYNKEHPDSGSEEHILFACGGGFYHYGIRVGRPGFKPRSSSMYRFEQLGDGVWGLYER